MKILWIVNLVMPALAEHLGVGTGSSGTWMIDISNMLSKGKKSNGVVTKFSLKKAINTGGIAYSQAQFAVDRALTPDEFALINKMSEEVKNYSKHIGFDVDSSADIVDEAPIVDHETGEIIGPLK